MPHALPTDHVSAFQCSSWAFVWAFLCWLKKRRKPPGQWNVRTARAVLSESLLWILCVTEKDCTPSSSLKFKRANYATKPATVRVSLLRNPPISVFLADSPSSSQSAFTKSWRMQAVEPEGIADQYQRVLLRFTLSSTLTWHPSGSSEKSSDIWKILPIFLQNVVTLGNCCSLPLLLWRCLDSWKVDTPYSNIK